MGSNPIWDSDFFFPSPPQINILYNLPFFILFFAAELSIVLQRLILSHRPLRFKDRNSIMDCNFGDPSLVTFYLCISLILNEEHFTFHIQFKHSGTLANRKYEELSHPKNHKKCDLILTLLKMRLNSSQSSGENATPSRGTSPLASYEEVPPPTPTG